MTATSSSPGPHVTRRAALAGAGAMLVGSAVAGIGAVARSNGPPPAPAFDGTRQAGIVTPRQAHLTLAAFDLVTPDREDLPRLLSAWTALCERAAGGPDDTGERAGLGPSGLTVTVGLGASLFDDRYGLRRRRPAGLSAGAFAGDERLDARHCGGDLLLQVCADDRQVVFHAVHQLANAALGIAVRRWTQHGFLSCPAPGATPRNVAGFKDGTANLSAADAGGLARHVWVPTGDGMAGGTYLVYRRIRMRLGAWDRSPVAAQELSIGRRKASGAPLGGRDEHDSLDPAATPPRSHVHAMHPDHNGGVRLLRRSYNYDDGATADGDADAGLAFVCFVADPRAQLAGLLRRFEHDDDLRNYAIPTAGAVFAVPPAPGPGEHIGQRLLI
jgi:deferrochelatase/peroxidase EfeB